MLKHVATAALLALPIACAAQSAGDAARTAELQKIASYYTRDNEFAGTVLVVEGDTVLLNQGYGPADVEWNIPNAPDVKFRLGSITKQFTAALVLLLQQDGKLKTTDPVSAYLPDAPPAWAKITVADLLGQTSGIPNFTDDPAFQTWRMNPRTPAEILAFFRNKPLDFERGAKFAYSNSNYEVLGAIAEKVGGQPYAVQLKTRLFDPLGMHDTALDNDQLILPRRAQGYTRTPAGLVHAFSESMTVPWAAGALVSTTGDLLRWERGLFGGKVLNAASLQQMTTPGKGGYGCGVFIRTEAGVTVVTHGGGIEGFNTDMSYLPDRKAAIIVLGNVNGSAPDRMGNNLVRAMVGEPARLQPEQQGK